jgi:hypothetical protein
VLAAPKPPTRQAKSNKHKQQSDKAEKRGATKQKTNQQHHKQGQQYTAAEFDQLQPTPTSTTAVFSQHKRAPQAIVCSPNAEPSHKINTESFRESQRVGQKASTFGRQRLP